MSQETMLWLNQNTLIGLTNQRGTAWHYRKSDQGAEPNHYPEFVPVADVERRLFHWAPARRQIAVVVPGLIDGAAVTYADEDGNPWSVVVQDDRQAITRSDTEAVLGMFKQSYVPHDYNEALLNNVALLLDSSKGDVGIGSAGLLRNGAQAWVQVQVPETIEVGGTQLLPYLTAATSLDGSMATTYLVGTDVVVCDNTLSSAVLTAHAKEKIRHSRNSGIKLADARANLEIMFATTDEIVTEIDRLQNTSVTDEQFGAVRAALDPRPEDKVTPTGRKSSSIAQWEKRQEKLISLWQHDNRVTPWRNTGWGTLMAFNTYHQHEQITKSKDKTHRAERNQLNALKGEVEKQDAAVLRALDEILAQSPTLAVSA